MNVEKEDGQKQNGDRAERQMQHLSVLKSEPVQEEICLTILLSLYTF